MSLTSPRIAAGAIFVATIKILLSGIIASACGSCHMGEIENIRMSCSHIVRQRPSRWHRRLSGPARAAVTGKGLNRPFIVSYAGGISSSARGGRKPSAYGDAAASPLVTAALREWARRRSRRMTR